MSKCHIVGNHMSSLIYGACSKSRHHFPGKNGGVGVNTCTCIYCSSTQPTKKKLVATSMPHLYAVSFRNSKLGNGIIKFDTCCLVRQVLP